MHELSVRCGPSFIVNLSLQGEGNNSGWARFAAKVTVNVKTVTTVSHNIRLQIRYQQQSTVLYAAVPQTCSENRPSTAPAMATSQLLFLYNPVTVALQCQHCDSGYLLRGLHVPKNPRGVLTQAESWTFLAGQLNPLHIPWQPPNPSLNHILPAPNDQFCDCTCGIRHVCKMDLGSYSSAADCIQLPLTTHGKSFKSGRLLVNVKRLEAGNLASLLTCLG